MPRVAHWDFSGNKKQTWVPDKERGDNDLQDGTLRRGAKQDGDGEATFDGKNDHMYVWEGEDFALKEGTVTMTFTPDDLDHRMGLFDRSAAAGTEGNLSISLTPSGAIEVRHVGPGGTEHVFSGGEISAGDEHSFSYSWGPSGSVLSVNDTTVASGEDALSTGNKQSDVFIGAALGDEDAPSWSWYNWGNSHDDDDDDEDNDDDESGGGAGASGYFDGTISDVEIWNHALGAPPPCFAAGTLIETVSGPVAVEDIRPGTLVITRDFGPLPVLWRGGRDISERELASANRLVPVVLRSGSFGQSGDLVLSQQHRVWLAGVDALAKARHLAELGDGRFRFAHGRKRIAYHHLLLPRHALIRAQGVWCESLYPETTQLSGLSTAEKLTLDAALEACHDTRLVRPELKRRAVAEALSLLPARKGRRVA
ncbi:MAG: Hint domain-containing protein [Pseudomonadota bacterium]